MSRDLALEDVLLGLAGDELLGVEVVGVGGAGGHAPGDVAVVARADHRHAGRRHAAQVDARRVELELEQLLGRVEAELRAVEEVARGRPAPAEGEHDEPPSFAPSVERESRGGPPIAVGFSAAVGNGRSFAKRERALQRRALLLARAARLRGNAPSPAGSWSARRGVRSGTSR